MPRPKAPPDTISEQRLWELARKGVDSDVLQARLVWTDAESIARYVRPLLGRARVHPRILPTAQTSGRWSTADPPRTNWPDHDPEQCPECRARPAERRGEWCPRAVREIVVPDPGTWWLSGDAEAIEARIAAAYTRDEQDLAAFAQGWDLHTITACGIFGLPLPPVLTKQAINEGPCVCEGGPEAAHAPDTLAERAKTCPAAWRLLVRWGGSADERRGVGKTFRYAWQYALHERAVLVHKDIVKLGLPKDQVLDFARSYARAKPGFFEGRRQRMLECARTGESRTFLGRLRRLYPRDNRPESVAARMKEGWSHQVQGSVSDIVNLTVIRWAARFPEAWLVDNTYDGLTMGFPDALPPEQVLPEVRALVEREWEVDGVGIRIPWSWKVVRP